MSRYQLGDLDVDRFVRRWLGSLDDSEVVGRELQDFARDNPAFGGYFLISNVGPQAVAVDASVGELILYAVLATYQNAGFPDTTRWNGAAAHLDAAFAYANRLGRSAVASRLLTTVVNRSMTPPPPRASGEHPAELAAYDREAAALSNRDIRAALLLDPTLSLDNLLLTSPLTDDHADW